MKRKIFRYTTLAVLVLAGLIASQVRFDISEKVIEAKYKLPESRFIDVKGLRVHYTDQGEGEVLLLLHGTAASLHTWQAWANALKKSFRVIRVDLPGFGLTGPALDRTYTTTAYVRFVENFLEVLKIRHLNIAGNSLGGKIAWNYTAAHLDFVNKLILVDSAGLPRVGKVPLPFRLARTPVLSLLARYTSPRFLVERSLKEVYFDDNKVTDTLVDRYFTLALREGNRQAFVDTAHQLVDETGEGLTRIKTPTLILWGRHDKWIPVEQAEKFHKLLSWSQLKIYENAGHVPQEEIPEETLIDVTKFLE